MKKGVSVVVVVVVVVDKWKKRYLPLSLLGENPIVIQCCQWKVVGEVLVVPHRISSCCVTKKNERERKATLYIVWEMTEGGGRGVSPQPRGDAGI